MIAAEIKGLDEIIKMLANVDKKIAKGAIRKGLRAGAKIVQAEVKSIAPSGTGALVRSYKVRAASKGKVIGIVVQTKKEDVYWDSFVEFGTKYQQPQHPLEKAAKNVEDKATDAVLEEIERAINES